MTFKSIKRETVKFFILTEFLVFRRATEISLIIKQTFETAIFTHLYPNSQIDIYIQVIQADGGSFAILTFVTFIGLLLNSNQSQMMCRY